MTTGIHVYVRLEQDGDQRHPLGTITFAELNELDLPKLASSWGLWHSDTSNTETNLSGQFFIDAKTRETGFELVVHDAD